MQPVRVAIAGKFDILHEGHIDHIKKASKLGDYLIIITHPDDIVAQMSEKGFCAQTLAVRKDILAGLLKQYHIRGEVAVSCDFDGTVAYTLMLLRPDLFAKGGDRMPDNMPANEVNACNQIGCEIVYGIGDLLNSSSRIANTNRR